MVTVRIPEACLSLTDRRREVRVDAATVAELIAAIDVDHPGFAGFLLDDSGLRRNINVYVGGQEVRYLHGLRTSVDGGDTVVILGAAGA